MLANAKHVSCGWEHSLIVSSTHQLYVFGSNRFGQLGIKKKSSKHRIKKKSSKPSKHRRFLPTLCHMLSDKKIIQTISGFHHSFALTQDNEIYSFGYNDQGALMSNRTPNSEPSKCNLPQTSGFLSKLRNTTNNNNGMLTQNPRFLQQEVLELKMQNQYLHDQLQQLQEKLLAQANQYKEMASYPANIDVHGKIRGECTHCDKGQCNEYMRPNNTSCNYCGCNAAQHILK